MQEEFKIQKNELNSIVRGIKNLYWGAHQLGHDLGSINGEHISTEYIIGRMNGTFFGYNRNEIVKGVTTYKKVDRISAFEILTSLLPQSAKPLGFGLFNLMDKSTMID